jgi:uncharacterized protein
MPRFSLFRKPKKETETEKPTVCQAEPKTEISPVNESNQKAIAEAAVIPSIEEKQEPIAAVGKTYLKAMPLKELSDVDTVKNEVKNGNIVILRVTSLANKSIDDVKTAVNELYAFVESIGGDIARLGEERVVICPKNIRIWREKTPIINDSLPTVAPTAA